MNVTALARKWCYQLWGSQSPDSDVPCSTCDAITAAIREALEPAIGILTSATWYTEKADLKQAIRDAIAALREGK